MYVRMTFLATPVRPDAAMSSEMLGNYMALETQPSIRLLEKLPVGRAVCFVTRPASVLFQRVIV